MVNKKNIHVTYVPTTPLSVEEWLKKAERENFSSEMYSQIVLEKHPDGVIHMAFAGKMRPRSFNVQGVLVDESYGSVYSNAKKISSYTLANFNRVISDIKLENRLDESARIFDELKSLGTNYKK